MGAPRQRGPLVTRMTPDERRAIQLHIAALADEIERLQTSLDVDPVETDTVQVLELLCACGLPRNHRKPRPGTEPTPCRDETARIALPGAPSRPPVPGTRP